MSKTLLAIPELQIQPTGNPAEPLWSAPLPADTDITLCRASLSMEVDGMWAPFAFLEDPPRIGVRFWMDGETPMVGIGSDLPADDPLICVSVIVESAD